MLGAGVVASVHDRELAVSMPTVELSGAGTSERQRRMRSASRSSSTGAGARSGCRPWTTALRTPAEDVRDVAHGVVRVRRILSCEWPADEYYPRPSNRTSRSYQRRCSRRTRAGTVPARTGTTTTCQRCIRRAASAGTRCPGDCWPHHAQRLLHRPPFRRSPAVRRPRPPRRLCERGCAPLRPHALTTVQVVAVPITSRAATAQSYAQTFKNTAQSFAVACSG
jgi:hypothetical protein